MKNIIGKKAIYKLKSAAGETISEVLVASLVVALGAIILVTMVMAAGKIITRSEEAFNQDLDSRNLIEYGESLPSDLRNSLQSESTVKIKKNEAAGIDLKLTIKPGTESNNAVKSISAESNLKNLVDIRVAVKNDSEILYVAYTPKE